MYEYVSHTYRAGDATGKHHGPVVQKQASLIHGLT